MRPGRRSAGRLSRRPFGRRVDRPGDAAHRKPSGLAEAITIRYYQNTFCNATIAAQAAPPGCQYGPSAKSRKDAARAGPARVAAGVGPLPIRRGPRGKHGGRYEVGRLPAPQRRHSGLGRIRDHLARCGDDPVRVSADQPVGASVRVTGRSLLSLSVRHGTPSAVVSSRTPPVQRWWSPRHHL